MNLPDLKKALRNMWSLLKDMPTTEVWHGLALGVLLALLAFGLVAVLKRC